MQVGALIAFLSYLIQILMSVMMATFVAVLAPRASVSADRIEEVLDARVVGRRRPSHRSPSSARPARSSSATSSSATPAPTTRCCATSRSRPGRADHRDHRQHRRGQDHAAEPRAPPVRRDRRCRARRRRRRPRPRTRAAVEPHRPGAAEAVPVLGHGRQQPPLRRPRRRPTRSSGGRCEIAQADDFVAGDARRPRRADQPGRLERVGRPAPAPRHRPGARPAAGHLPVRRLVLGARPRHRRPAARRARPRSSPTR